MATVHFLEQVFYYSANLLGVGIYNNIFIWNKTYSAYKFFEKADVKSLSKLIATGTIKCWWHWKSLFLETMVVVPSIIWFKYLGASRYSIRYGLLGFSFVAANHLYSILAHNYNNFRAKQQILIYQAKPIMMEEIPVEENDPAEPIHQHPDQITWLVQPVHKNNKIIYIVCNTIYPSLTVIFDKESVAHEFVTILQTMNADQIKYLDDNPRIIRELRLQFIKNKSHGEPIQQYAQIIAGLTNKVI